MVFCIRHTTGRKPFPDQLIQTELISGQRILNGSRKSSDIRRTNGFVGILDLFVSFFFGCLFSFGRHIGISISFLNIFCCCSRCLLRNTGGVRTQVGDDSYGPKSFHINAFIELLGQTHSLRSGKIQHLRRLLLKRTGRKGQRCFLRPLSILYFRNCK